MTTLSENITTSPSMLTSEPPGGLGILSDGEIFTLIVMLVVTALSLVGNLLVIAAVYIRESLRTPNNIFLVNLALADLGQGIVAIPLRMTEIFNRGKITLSLKQRRLLCCNTRTYSMKDNWIHFDNVLSRAVM